MTLLKKHNLLFAAVFALVAALALNFFASGAYKNEERYATVIERKLQEELKTMNRQLEEVSETIEQAEQSNFSTYRQKTRYPYYLYRNGRLIFWSTHLYAPDYSELNERGSPALADLAEGIFLVKKKTLDIPGQVELFMIMPLYHDYAINNQYIESEYNQRIFPNPNLQIKEPGASGATIEAEGKPLFSVQFGEDYQIKFDPVQALTLLLIVVSIILGLLYISSAVNHLTRSKREQHAFAILAGGLILFRTLLLIFNFPFSIVELKLFNPMYYASSFINPSLGDLALNVIVILAITVYLFRHFYKFPVYQKIIRSGDNVKDILSILLITVTFFLLYYVYFVIKGLNFHSQWTFDINRDIAFPYLKIVSYIIVYLVALIYFLASHTIYKIYLRINRRSRFYRIFDFVIGALLFVTISLIVNANFLVVGIVNAVYFGVIYMLDFPKYMNKVQYKTFFYYFFASIAIAVVGAYVIYHHQQRESEANRKRLADWLLIENDYAGEFYLNEAAQKIKEDVFIKSRMLNPFLSKDIIEQKIRRVYLSSYFDKYDVKIYLFGPNGNPLGLDNSTTNYHAVKSEFEDDETEYDNIYFRNMMNARTPKQYLVFIELERQGYNNAYNIGNIVIDLKLKRIIPNSVYPELLVDQSDMMPYVNSGPYRDYSYAIISQGQVNYTSGDFNYMRDFDSALLRSPQLYDEGLKTNGFWHYAKESVDGKIIIVSSPAYPAINVASNFSFLFLTLIFITLAILIAYALYYSLKKIQLNYATKIQIYSNFAFFIPLLTISIATLSVLISSYKKDVEAEYLSKAENMSEEMVEPVYNYYRDASVREELSGHLAQIAGYANVDINLFSVNGRLIVSTQPTIYENNILSEYINPQALIEIVERKNNSVILNESVGDLTYKSTYVAIRYFLSGDLMGILSIPFFESRHELNQQIIVVFTRIINIFTFIFIASLIVSYFASKWLTFPLRLITQKIRRTSLSEYNEPVTWSSNDEIGLMVGEYNRMLENLEESKKALARSEKESAWREMARQVAHEIKNPLTPMKLTLQHLKRMIESNSTENNSLSEKPINTLLHHVDTLSDIAESFSTFAQMPLPENEKFEVASVLRKTLNLYDTETYGNIETDIEAGEFLVVGDDQWMGRIFSNLIINGFQAIPEGRTPRIFVSLHKTENEKVLIEIRDNGAGIPEKIRDKIFIPNFSTKRSGSGIGLAVAKRGVEHAGGKIWFDSEENVGSSFFIELPLAD